MKLFSPNRTARPRPLQLAFTLVEMMVVMLVFSFIVAAIVALQIFALRIYRMGSAKLITSTEARETMNMIRDQIRCSKTVYVGTYTSGSFSRIASGTAQQGNALQIAYGNNSTNCMIYYLDTTQVTNTLYSISNNVAGTLTTQARFITNNNCFIAEDYRGTVCVNYLNNPVIHVLFQFNELGYPQGGGNVYQFYYLSTRVMRRAKD